ncbi:hypothetical protein [Paenibacillus macquariensis]|uniref:Uncharacterized protein n=1 Tax=Paenibacillus macquariensis TaxID=948756 RepID=A0ABY1K1F5_9BACL|nr:hypothetical protein [Paenibacillus macquariensis]MEC0091792.1 hypothetical protein [Paenibacillus macquariensis]OAB32296.1 hypothetical protein PMSM_16945 [Paenibacillus macquariensis subsp. macquariensis]SIR11890.1 hypothetical protein SAMN05421578_107123 [Paenibacillus macquariensis]
MIVNLVVRVVDKQERIIGGYVKEMELPFVPTIGMKFKQGSSTWLWETENGELNPSVKEIVYNIDEEKLYCLFDIHESLKSSFWKEIPYDILARSFELSQFETRE